MARKRMVTRTIVSTIATVKCADLVGNTVFKESVNLSGTFKNTEGALKAAKKLMDSDSQKVLKVLDMQEQTQLYGMTEEEFMANANIIEK